MSKGSSEPAAKKKRGLSVDDKRKLLLNLYHEKAEPFNLKELEALGSKIGIVQQTIKDVNQSLVDDSFVSQDKIGSGNFFWSFPVKAVQDLTVSRDRLVEDKANQIKLHQELEAKIQEAKSVRVAKDRKEKLHQLQNLLQEERSIDKQLEEIKVNDPDTITNILKQAAINKQAADRWTDNIWAIKTFLTKKKGLSAKEVNAMLKIDSNFDYVQD